MWTCPKCTAKVDPAYEVCWRCGTTPQGVEDLNFVPADTAALIEGPRLFSGLAAEAGKEGGPATELAAAHPSDLVECYWARDTMEAEHLAARLIEADIPAVADSQDLRLRGAGAAVTNPLALGNPYFGPRVRVLREDLARARACLETYEQHKPK